MSLVRGIGLDLLTMVMGAALAIFATYLKSTRTKHREKKPTWDSWFENLNAVGDVSIARDHPPDQRR